MLINVDCDYADNKDDDDNNNNDNDGDDNDDVSRSLEAILNDRFLLSTDPCKAFRRD